MSSRLLSAASSVAIVAAVALSAGAWFYHQQSTALKANIEELKQTREAFDQSVQQARNQAQALNDAVKNGEQHQREQMLRARRAASLVNGLNAASSVKTAMAESYMTNMKWPGSNQEAGIPSPDSFKARNVISISVQPYGKIRLNLADPDGKREQLWLTGAVNKAMQVSWKCTTEDVPDIAQLIPACSYSGR